MIRPRVVLCGVGARVEGLRWESDTRLRIGRHSALEVVVHDASVSREHAEIASTPPGWVLRDLGSGTGTYLNTTRLEGGGRLVRAGDLIRVGRVPFQVAVAQRPAPGAAADWPQAQIRGGGTCFHLIAATRRPWERAVEQLARPQDQRLRPARRVLPLLRAGVPLTQPTSPDELLYALLRDVVTALEAPRGTIALADGGSGKLRPRAAVTAGATPRAENGFSETLAERCFLEGESLLCAGAGQDLRGPDGAPSGTMASVICALLRSPRRRLGVLHLDRGPFQEPFTRDDFDLADAVACYVSVGIESALLLEQQRDLFVRAATALTRAADPRDGGAGDHTRGVTACALMLAEELGLSAAERQHIEIGAPLHDIGETAVADAVLRKPGRLTPEEWEQVRAHAARGAALLRDVPGLAPVLPIVLHHHERWDGGGYPAGLAGEAIPLLARVVAVADAFEAMTADRPYRRARTPDEALAELAARAGSHFDPHCVAAFLRLRPRVEARPARAPAPPTPSGVAITVQRRRPKPPDPPALFH